MKENKKKLGKNAEIELDESGVEQVAGGWGFDSFKSGFNYVAEKVNSAAGAVNDVVQTGNDLVDTVQTGADAVGQAVTDTKDNVSNIL